MTQEEFISLYKKYLQGDCTPEEEELIFSWKDEIELLDDAWNEDMGKQSEIYSSIDSRLNTSIKKHEKPTFSLNYGNKWLQVAAAIIIVASLILLLPHTKKKERHSPVTALKTQPQIAPGTNKAYLTLSNGSKIILNDAHNGNISTQSGIQLNKVQDGLIAYSNGKAQSDLQSSKVEIIYNTITTPRGGEYQIMLSDGTKVWLNAASSLRFPVTFKGNTRSVELTGEAYFEVAKNKEKPFIVQANGNIVQVLGTHFNVSAYEDDEEVTTTLAEGSVLVSKENSNAKLSPGQQAISINKRPGITIQAADVDEALAWKNGFFNFHDENIVSVMKKVSRWYDIDVQYKGDVIHTEFGGTMISKYKGINDLLDIIKLTGAVTYKIDGRKIIIIK